MKESKHIEWRESGGYAEMVTQLRHLMSRLHYYADDTADDIRTLARRAYSAGEFGILRPGVRPLTEHILMLGCYAVWGGLLPEFRKKIYPKIKAVEEKINGETKGQRDAADHVWAVVLRHWGDLIIGDFPSKNKPVELIMLDDPTALMRYGLILIDAAHAAHKWDGVDAVERMKINILFLDAHDAALDHTEHPSGGRCYHTSCGPDGCELPGLAGPTYPLAFLLECTIDEIFRTKIDTF